MPPYYVMLQRYAIYISSQEYYLLGRRLLISLGDTILFGSDVAFWMQFPNAHTMHLSSVPESLKNRYEKRSVFHRTCMYFLHFYLLR